MKRQIRRGVFETNSSSVHSLTMCSENEYDKWIKEELVYDCYKDKLVPIDEEIKESMDSGDHDYLTYEQFNDYHCMPYTTFNDGYTTKNGEKVIAFGYYGHD